MTRRASPVVLFQCGRLRDISAGDMTGVTVEGIASALAKINRFVGHTRYPYSVAQHAVLVSYLCPEHAYDGLHHDDTEAFVGDMASPIKRECRSYRALEARLRLALVPVLGLSKREPETVKGADQLALVIEQEHVQGREELVMPVPAWVLGYVREMTWHDAYVAYMDRHQELGGK